MDIDEVKKELTENMEGANADYTNYPENGEYPQGYASGCEYAIELLENLQEKKVVIPEFVADWIEKAKAYYGDAVSLFKIVYWIGNHAGSIESHYKWLNDEDNQKLLLNAVANGYEVEKEPRYRIKLPGLAGSNGQQYISKSADGKLFACARRDYLQQEFTNDELKQLPDWIRRLELEEFKDD
ncbi:DUF1642 domain-containing protein [Pediococcus acidilactici]|uniref:DUF1642 domain-containing protein n=1 Tax=Pediococcus acidilactici TaxID=1254 RepID=UPI001326EB5A|nr:DUF1642 domain-containing protein [Pediococcus acidilactici]KAF0343821.1 DUF1642 domain-containing protein [Pediococcus acidilactici]KAF0353119.1 DUF1642 domain-containing protein [Pediococcus acidilactici]KAF0357408.1 DUF1642 domain-containing protein [Pediococcus acidilactici]KAF0361798.1 DUF1642 domain-containing protein [Pediococcus acidilactici]KAF0408486.1 DUF1642 domain-containing protein [Pediococcus acidilactici]